MPAHRAGCPAGWFPAAEWRPHPVQLRGDAHRWAKSAWDAWDVALPDVAGAASLEPADADAERLADRARGVPEQGAAHPYWRRGPPASAAGPCIPGAARSAEQSFAAPAWRVAGEQTQRAAQGLPVSRSRAAPEEPQAHSAVPLPAAQPPRAGALTAWLPVEGLPAQWVYWAGWAGSRPPVEPVAE